jgi:hypothetical protein
MAYSHCLLKAAHVLLSQNKWNDIKLQLVLVVTKIKLNRMQQIVTAYKSIPNCCSTEAHGYSHGFLGIKIAPWKMVSDSKKSKTLSMFY